MEFLHAWMLGTITGVLFGVACMALYKRLARRRSLQRKRLATFILSLSRMVLADTRRLFPKELFPPWIVFSRHEKIDWVNQEVAKAWPFLEKATCTLLKEWMESTLEFYKPAIFASLKLRKFTLGTISPQFSGVEIMDSKQDEITMELDFQWAGNPNIILMVQTLVGVSLPIQIKNTNFVGTFRLTFKPLCDDIPCFQAIVYSLRELKTLDFDLKVVGGNVSSVPGLQNMVEGLIKTAITDSLIWPMRQIFKVFPGDYRDLEVQVTGVLQVKLVQGKNLLNKDMIGKSDPFAILYIRPIPSRMKKSKTVDNDLNPIWNETFKFEVEDLSTQSLFIRVLDEEGVQEAEFLGCAKLELKKLKLGQLIDIWVPLVKDFDMTYTSSTKYRGEIHLELSYTCCKNGNMLSPILRLTIPRNPISRQLTSLERIFSTKDDTRSPSIKSLMSPSSLKESTVIRGILSLTVLRADELVRKKPNKAMDPYVLLKMKKSKTIMRTKVVPSTFQPEWNENFHIIVEDALHEMMILEVWDHRTFNERFIGKCALTLTNVLQKIDSDIEVQLEGVESGKVFLHFKWRDPSPSDPQFL